MHTARASRTVSQADDIGRGQDTKRQETSSSQGQASFSGPLNTSTVSWSYSISDVSGIASPNLSFPLCTTEAKNVPYTVTSGRLGQEHPLG